MCINVFSTGLFPIAKYTIIMLCHIKSKVMSVHRKDYRYRIGTCIIRTKWGNRIKRKYIYISKQNCYSEIVSGSGNDTLFKKIHEVSPYMLCLSKHSKISEI